MARQSLPLSLVRTALLGVRDRMLAQGVLLADAKLLGELAELLDDAPSKAALRQQRYYERKKKKKADADPDVSADVTTDVRAAYKSASDQASPRAFSEQDLSQDQGSTEESKNERESSSNPYSIATARAIAARADVSTDASIVARETLTVRARVELEHPGIASAALYQRLSEQLRVVTKRAWDVQGHLAAWGWIAGQSAAEWDLVLAAIGADPWCTENAGKVSPQHIRRQWPTYAEPPKPSAVAATPAARADRVRELQGELRTARARHRAAPPSEHSALYPPIAELERQLVSLGVIPDEDEAAA